MARSFEELTGEFDYIKRKYPAPDEQVKILPGILIDGTQVVGTCREDELESGLTYCFYGFWSETKYGKQFMFHSFRLAQPSGKRGTIAYLQRGPGIGRKRAEQIWDIYGPAALEAFRTEPGKVAAKVSGLTEQRAKEAATYFAAHVALEATTKDLLELLAGGGFPRKLIDKLIEKWGARAAVLIRENAYRLMIFRNVGYGKADKLYLQLGGRPDTAERLGWCAWNALHKEREGHTWRPLEFGILAITKGVAGVDVVPQAGLDWAIQQHHIAVRKNGDGKVWIAEGERAAAEKRLASQVHRAMVEGVEA